MSEQRDDVTAEQHEGGEPERAAEHADGGDNQPTVGQPAESERTTQVEQAENQAAIDEAAEHAAPGTMEIAQHENEPIKGEQQEALTGVGGPEGGEIPVEGGQQEADGPHVQEPVPVGHGVLQDNSVPGVQTTHNPAGTSVHDERVVETSAVEADEHDDDSKDDDKQE